METNGKTTDQLLDERLVAIEQGFKEAIRREVKTLHDQGLPITVLRNGRIVDANPQNGAGEAS